MRNRAESARAERSPATSLPWSLRVAAEGSWRVLLVLALVAVVAHVLVALRLVVLPILLALFLATMLAPPARRLRALGAPDAVAALAVVGGALAGVAGIASLLGPRVAAETDALGRDVSSGLEQVGSWLVEGPLGLTREDIESGIDETVARLGDNAGTVTSGVLSGAALAAEVLIGVALTIVLTFFVVKDGERMWSRIVARAPEPRREGLERLGRGSWKTLGGYLRGIAVVAAFDALFIGLALVVLGVPLALPLAVLTFFGAFVPVVGALVTGAAAVLVALVTGGLDLALATMAAVIVVQQVESHVLHPIVVGRALNVPPVAILLSVTTGAIVLGIAGALLAAPLLAVMLGAAGTGSADEGDAEPAG